MLLHKRASVATIPPAKTTGQLEAVISSDLLSQHLQNLRSLWDAGLDAADYDAAWVCAGEAMMHFRDDHGPHYKPSAYLSQWVDPAYITPGSRLWHAPGSRPTLFLLAEEDYWHAPAALPNYLDDLVSIRTFADTQTLQSAIQQHEQSFRGAVATIGPPESTPGDNHSQPDLNPSVLLNYLDYHRAVKSGYELALMRAASDIGARGHLAAAAAFLDGGSEFDIHMAYLVASAQNESELPYGNIVALNEHGATLHYQHQVRRPPSQHRSLLIDAGGQYQGYASDITRTYAAQGSTHELFHELLNAMQAHQDQLIESISPGQTFADLHVQMHQQLAELLVRQDIVQCDAANAVDLGITRAFCPHGLGHLLGVQVHDAGGHMADAQGTPAPPPSIDATLRFTRTMEQDQVFTIEPGLYFIPSLLASLKQDKAPINWSKVDALTPYGGIRIEDNVRVLSSGVENLTRQAFDALI